MSAPPPDHSNQSESPLQPLFSDFADDADMAELVEFFVNELNDRVDTINGAFATGDEYRLRTVAHQLKGAAACYGFPGITESAAELERVLAEEGELAALTERVEDLVGLCRRAAASGGRDESGRSG